MMKKKGMITLDKVDYHLLNFFKIKFINFCIFDN